MIFAANFTSHKSIYPTMASDDSHSQNPVDDEKSLTPVSDPDTEDDELPKLRYGDRTVQSEHKYGHNDVDDMAPPKTSTSSYLPRDDTDLPFFIVDHDPECLAARLNYNLRTFTATIFYSTRIGCVGNEAQLHSTRAWIIMHQKLTLDMTRETDEETLENMNRKREELENKLIAL